MIERTKKKSDINTDVPMYQQISRELYLMFVMQKCLEQLSQMSLVGASFNVCSYSLEGGETGEQYSVAFHYSVGLTGYLLHTKLELRIVTSAHQVANCKNNDFHSPNTFKLICTTHKTMLKSGQAPSRINLTAQNFMNGHGL